MVGTLILAVFVAGSIHNYLPKSPASMWEFIYVNLEIYVSIIVLYAVIIAAGNIPSEFSKGAIKLLLIRPISRSKVLLSKYIATVSFSLGMLVTTFALSLLVGGIFFCFYSSFSGKPIKNKSISVGKVYSSFYLFNCIIFFDFIFLCIIRFYVFFFFFFFII